MSIKLNTPEKIIDTVITHQFQSATQALTNNKSIEFSGFGKFVFNDKKAIAKLAKLEGQKSTLEGIINDETLSAQKRRSAEMKLESVVTNIELLKPKINEA
jgi:hypothetical protein